METHGGSTAGPFVSFYKDEIENVLSSMGGSGRLSVKDIGKFSNVNHPPLWGEFKNVPNFADIFEDAGQGALVVALPASDMDQNDALTYSIEDRVFKRV